MVSARRLSQLGEQSEPSVSCHSQLDIKSEKESQELAMCSQVRLAAGVADADLGSFGDNKPTKGNVLCSPDQWGHTVAGLEAIHEAKKVLRMIELLTKNVINMFSIKTNVKADVAAIQRNQFQGLGKGTLDEIMRMGVSPRCSETPSAGSTLRVTKAQGQPGREHGGDGLPKKPARAKVRSLILERPSSHQMMQTTLPVWNGLDRADRLFVHCVEL
ncbi:hypothetical protein Tco_0861023 [Tanacetum coccineum]|uniref:Uncharacterized protein n=1 Tax=Tanacetum coccineum TaxID=301880 RepID=A0ABQ5BJZ9_9ASTR